MRPVVGNLLNAVHGDEQIKSLRRHYALHIDGLVKAQAAAPNVGTISLLAHLVVKLPKVMEPRVDVAKAVELWLEKPEQATPEVYSDVIEILVLCAPLLIAHAPAQERLTATLLKLRQFLTSAAGTPEQRMLALYVLELQACDWRTADSAPECD